MIKNFLQLHCGGDDGEKGGAIQKKKGYSPVRDLAPLPAAGKKKLNAYKLTKGRTSLKSIRNITEKKERKGSHAIEGVGREKRNGYQDVNKWNGGRRHKLMDTN